MLNLSLRNSWANLAPIPLEEIDADLIDHVMTPHISGVTALLAPRKPEQSELLTAEKVARSIRDTIDDSARKSFQMLVPEERRGRVSTFMNNYLPSVGTILACVLTGGVILVSTLVKHDLHIGYLVLAIVGAAAALWAIFKMHAAYDTSLLSWRLKRRQRSSSALMDKLNF